MLIQKILAIKSAKGLQTISEQSQIWTLAIAAFGVENEGRNTTDL